MGKNLKRLHNLELLSFYLWKATKILTVFSLTILFVIASSKISYAENGNNNEQSVYKTWNMNSSGIGHLIGRSDGDGWSANIAQDPPGVLSYGPYETGVKSGRWAVNWVMKIDNNHVDNADVVRLEVYDADEEGIIASNVISRQQFAKADQFQEFTVQFTQLNPSHRLEFRVFWYDKAYVNLKTVSLKYVEDNKAKFWQVAKASQISHQVGRLDGGGWSANTAQDSVGFLSYGPYETEINSGIWSVSWLMKIDNNRANNANVVRLDIYDADAKEVLLSKEITRQQFTKENQFQNFSLQFSHFNPSHRLEFRTFWYDEAYINLYSLSLEALDDKTSKTWEAAKSPEISHIIGRLDGIGWSANTDQDSPGFLSYGPYVTGVDLGVWIVNWSMKIDNISLDNAEVLRLEIYDSDAGEVLMTKEIKRREFTKENEFQDFSLQFPNFDPSHHLEFRTFWYDKANINLHNISLKKFNSNTIQYLYDKTGRLIYYIYPTGRVINLQYDRNGNLLYKKELDKIVDKGD
ncbi:hypothetical protein [Paenibacillus chitinolyticus]|uniref:hypothetical protein n=1 Tax=Paenibacillus chitinolyticus TaxID=79263 RepID=UPI003D0370EE